MTNAEIIKKVLRYGDWEFWAERPFGAFLLSLFKNAVTRSSHGAVGVNAELPAMLFQDGGFYKSEKVWDAYEKQLSRHIAAGGNFFDLSRQAEQWYRKNKRLLQILVKTKQPSTEKLEILKAACERICTYVWLTHGFEHYYLKQLRREVPKYISGDTDKYIGDISFPSKKNAHVRLEQRLRGRGGIPAITKEYAWIKCRDGFSAVFTEAEMSLQRRKLRRATAKKWVRPTIPLPLRPLAKITAELVYFRTFRSDMLYEFLYIARPILQQRARELGVPYEFLKNYAIDDIISGRLALYRYPGIAATWGRHFALLEKPPLKPKTTTATQVKGTPAFSGMARGRAKIVKVAGEISKVAKGDILIAPTTFPSFIMGMKRAAAFVTDEGGITSHAAIVSRELKKPCVIGTKTATKVFKDGDLIEVDAQNGIVKKL